MKSENPVNFSDMIELGRDRGGGELYNIAVYAQDIENQLWDGYPYVYPSIRVLLDTFFDFIINTLKRKKVLIININKANGMTFKELVSSFDKWQKNHTFLSNIKEGLTIQNLSVFSIDAKEQLVRNFYLACGLSESTDENWGTHTLIKNLNKRSHKIDLLNNYETEDVLKNYRNRFEIMRIIHDGIFTDIIQSTYSERKGGDESWPMKLYQSPDDEELQKIIFRFKERQEKNGTGIVNFKSK